MADDEKAVNAVVPDYMEPILAYRFFWQLGLDKSPFFVSGHPYVYWPAKQPMKAIHQPRRYALQYDSPPCEDSPCSGTCGIYALKLDQIPMAVKTYSQDFGFTSPAMFLVEINLWGRIVEHEYGYRAQYAYPKRILATDGNPADAAALAATYGIPYLKEEEKWKLAPLSERSSPNQWCLPSSYLQLPPLKPLVVGQQIRQRYPSSFPLSSQVSSLKKLASDDDDQTLLSTMQKLQDYIREYDKDAKRAREAKIKKLGL